MCGRYRRRSDKQRIAEAFHVSIGLEELYFAAEDDIAPGSIQPVVLARYNGDRKIEMMRWGFQLSDRLLFNARSEGIDTARFWKEGFARRRCHRASRHLFRMGEGEKGSQTEIRVYCPRPRTLRNGGHLVSLEESENGQMGRHIRYPDRRRKCTDAICSRSATNHHLASRLC